MLISYSISKVPIRGGFQPITESHRIEVLASKLDDHVATALGEPGAKVQNIVTAQSQRVNGINYRIFANVLVDKNAQLCCFAMHESFFGPITVSCAECGECSCFQ